MYLKLIPGICSFRKPLKHKADKFREKEQLDKEKQLKKEERREEAKKRAEEKNIEEKALSREDKFRVSTIFCLVDFMPKIKINRTI